MVFSKPVSVLPYPTISLSYIKKAYKQWKWNNQRQDAVSSSSTTASSSASSAAAPFPSISSAGAVERRETLRHPLQPEDDRRRLPSNEVVDENDISMLLGDDHSQNGQKQRFFKVPFNTSGSNTIVYGSCCYK